MSPESPELRSKIARKLIEEIGSKFESHFGNKVAVWDYTPGNQQLCRTLMSECDVALQKAPSDDPVVQKWGQVLKARCHGVQGGIEHLKQAKLCYDQALASVPAGSDHEGFISYFYALWAGVAGDDLGGGRQKQIQLLEKAIQCVGAASEHGIGYAALLAKVRASAQGESKKSGGCFVATAACGDPLAPEVITLSAFRDEVLLRSRNGRLFVRVYYTLSPPVAAVIARSSTLRCAAMAMLVKPLARMVAGFRLRHVKGE
jgi:hypothetical protein